MEAAALAKLLAVARGDAPADLVLFNLKLVNVFTAEVYPAEVAIVDQWVAGVGSGYQAESRHDLGGRYLLPGLIDAHIHIESSLSTPAAFARVALVHGTTTVITDPHEIANVCGVDGIRYMLEASEGLPLSVLVNLPSCVPASPLSTSGAVLEAAALVELADHPRVLGLAEFMDVPGATSAEAGALAKLSAFRGRVIDGHAPGVLGKQLQAYVAGGPRADHESVTPAEVVEKLRAGLYVFLRQGTAARNLLELLPALTPENARRVAFCSDDRHPADLLDQGQVDYMVRLGIRAGLDPVRAVQMATLNAAEAFGLLDRGAVAPGRRADLVVVDDLEGFEVRYVYAGGVKVVEDGAFNGDSSGPKVTEYRVRNTIRREAAVVDFSIPAEEGLLRVIGVHSGQLVTQIENHTPRVLEGLAVADTERDLLKAAVLERHGKTGNVGLGFVRGLGLLRGAIAGSVGHDSHNLIVVGADDVSMNTALAAVIETGGGFAAALGGHMLARLPLPIAGLMSDQPLSTVRAQMDELLAAALELGSPLHDPFMPMAFLSLEVIPFLKLTDRGLVDVERMQLISLWT